ncbi:hypothetical protein LJ739_06975 [Aestuariibacter halophilus]|uniref:Uncharacterized protein n=1 Tax=Fluctibacter halophilus TaxID=226011 RepID=A0ABS8G5Z8_9ALTE|nr:hypothetical protein [Aestuariibacter halophilus]MCC2615980.1 hypothetical protein [Aestuariibacter halophilus]
MKFESKFGIGEIVCRDVMKSDELYSSELYEVVSISFGKDGRQVISCLHAQTQRIIHFDPVDIEGDPDFDQSSGKYIYREQANDQ